jgi:hypothetical protein
MPRWYQFPGEWLRLRFLLWFLNPPHKVVRGWGEGFAAEGATAMKAKALSIALLSLAHGTSVAACTEYGNGAVRLPRCKLLFGAGF